jgi:hypothetical protein
MKVRFGLAYRGQADLALDDFPQAVPPTDWTAELETLAADILERQT